MDIFNTLQSGERVTSVYAENYFDDESIESETSTDSSASIPVTQKVSVKKSSHHGFKEDWVSPSDLLIGKIELKPPFTSKIHRGITHEGIISMGGAILAKERKKFEAELKRMLHENDAAWQDVLSHEKEQIKQKVWMKYNKLLEHKSKVMSEEMTHFYENSLQELETHLRSELEDILVRAHANIVSDLNFETVEKLREEELKLEEHLRQQYESEINKITRYYKLMLDHELNNNEKLINEAIHDKNDALNAFRQQFEAETTTTTMYVMSSERKKCKIKQFLLENYQGPKIIEKLQENIDKQEILDLYQENERCISDINFEWKEKVRKILQIFLKFISYSLKLLPEQSTFLLDLEKMFVLQLNEIIQKKPETASNILIHVEDNLNNIFSFEQAEEPGTICDKEPFELVGGTSDTIPTSYGSRDTLPSHVDLPTITYLSDRRYVYAKCNKFDEIQELLNKKCTCMGQVPTPSTSASDSETGPICTCPPLPVSPVKTESSIELMKVDTVKRVESCPFRYCRDWTKYLTFDISPYLDYTEDNFEFIENQLSFPCDKVVLPEIISPKEIAHEKLAFVESARPYRDALTQCSSQEDVTELKLGQMICPCVKSHSTLQQKEIPGNYHKDKTKRINELMLKRKISMQRILFSNPNLLKIFNEESFDFKF